MSFCSYSISELIMYIFSVEGYGWGFLRPILVSEGTLVLVQAWRRYLLWHAGPARFMRCKGR